MFVDECCYLQAVWCLVVGRSACSDCPFRMGSPIGSAWKYLQVAAHSGDVCSWAVSVVACIISVCVRLADTDEAQQVQSGQTSQT